MSGKLSIKILFFLLLQFCAVIPSQAAEEEALRQYLISGDDNGIEIKSVDWRTGHSHIEDSISYANMDLSRDIGWDLYDPIHNRFFFIGLFSPELQDISILNLDSRTVSYLRLKDYIGSGDYPYMLLSPGSKYVILTYKHSEYGTYEVPIEHFKTVVLDGATLEIISERYAMALGMDIKPEPLSYVSTDNRYLYNIEYLAKSASNKADAIVRYELPDLIPQDTTFLDELAWNGTKKVYDIFENNLLIAGINNSDESIPFGRYLFIIDGMTDDIISEIIPSGLQPGFKAVFSPDGTEVIAITRESGEMRRYSLPDGEIIGELNGLPAFRGAVFRADGNLYLSNRDSIDSYTIVDYRNDQVIETLKRKY